MPVMIEVRRARGFTLIDLAFAMAVAAVFASVFAISTIGRTDSAKADIAARQTLEILDAARWVQAHRQWEGVLNGEKGYLPPLPAAPKAAAGTMFRPRSDGTGFEICYPGSPIDPKNPAGPKCPNPGFWPGQGGVWPSNADKYKCAGMIDYQTAINDLTQSVQNPLYKRAMLQAAPANQGGGFTNPWGELYEFSLSSPVGSDGQPGTPAAKNALNENVEANCWFVVSTNVPKTVANDYISPLPFSSCSLALCPKGTKALTRQNFVRCCTMIPRPGLEPRFMDWIRVEDKNKLNYPDLWCAPWFQNTDSDRNCLTDEAK